ILYAILHHAEWWITLRTGMQCRVGLITAIYRKCLNLSVANTSSTGLIVNLVSNDVQRFEDLAPYLHYTWVALLQLLVYMGLMYVEIGWAMLSPIVCIFLMIPVQAVFAHRFNAFRRQTVGFRDERIKSLSDMLSGILVVKLYAWETPFLEQINGLRESELGYIWKGNVMKACNYAFYFASGALINAITFSIYWALGGELTPGKVFSVIIYLNVLKFSIVFFMPMVTQFLSECMVSVQRIEEFLSLSDLSSKHRDQDDELFCEPGQEDALVVLRDACFSWESAEQKTSIQILNQVSLSIKRRSLTFVVGPVGSGKTSLLNGILGDMTLSSGRFAVDRQLKKSF
ncbi:Multidrug resistance-associated protein 4, partial [Kappamyces sp. JEL0680]